jgi:hypothetical protein
MPRFLSDNTGRTADAPLRPGSRAATPPAKPSVYIDFVPDMFHASFMSTMIDTLGKASRHNMLVLVECRLCHRQAKFLAHDLAAFYGYATPPGALPFRCEACNTRDCKVMLTERDFERNHEMVVWRPMKIRQG